MKRGFVIGLILIGCWTWFHGNKDRCDQIGQQIDQQSWSSHWYDTSGATDTDVEWYSQNCT